ncbi:MAG TPA: PspC domain-containing protein [Saprospiraceae bacterium]|nr:PspC domain-containing protein [Saprospiraceae bacterium]
MNKILHINVGGYPFTIDQDAYNVLDHYLVGLEAHFSNSEGCQEIIKDIESRMAELFKEKQQYGGIINTSIVNQCIQIMGTPEDFGVPNQEDKNPNSNSFAGNGKTQAEWGIKTGKKVFRDMENAKFQGVCAGFANYFGIQDVTWVRLGFCLGAFAGGFTIPLYLICWAAIPEARTSMDRLSMMGEPINIDTISKKVEEQFDHITQKFESWQDKRQKRKAKWRF